MTVEAFPSFSLPPHRVASYSDANKMPAASLAKVFGPTIVGHGCANPEPSVMWQDTQKQPKVGEYLSIAAFTAMKAWMLS